MYKTAEKRKRITVCSPGCDRKNKRQQKKTFILTIINCTEINSHR